MVAMKRLFFLIPITILLFSCQEEDKFSDADYAAYFSENSISSDVEFYPEEIFKSNEPELPELRLRFSTKEIFPCANYQIQLTTAFVDDELIVRFESILKPQVCLTAMGTATTSISLPENVKKLVLVNGQTVDVYDLSVSESKVEILTGKNNFTEILHLTTFRYPENSFAYVCGTNVDNTNLYDDFLKILSDSLSLTEISFDGEGRIPYPEMSSGHWVDFPSKYFTYENEAEFDKAGDQLKKFTQENIRENDGVGIYLTNWKNKSYRSWMFNQ